jgi:GTP-binding protein
MFLDEARVEFVSGAGGSGAVGFHREKHVPRGGPNGADGGRGGDVVLIADRSVRTLYDLTLRQRVEAEDGVHAIGNKKGRNGKTVEVKVPIGTLVYDIDLDELLADLNLQGMRYVVCRGGKGGFGNQHYVSSVRQAPNFAQKGAPSETVRARLELKLLADVGLIGLPNAGKSTLLGQMSAARPKVADYPFTTIVPNLGVVRVADTTFVVADMPGLIEGASLGHGLGHQFLRHVERTKVLVHLVDGFPIDGSDPIANFHMIESELRAYDERLWARPRLLALNKIDLAPIGDFGSVRERFEALGLPLFTISGATGEGVEALKFAMMEALAAAEAAEPMLPVVLPVLRRDDEQEWDVIREDEGFEVTGRRIRRMVAMTDLGNRDAVRYLHKRLVRLGVIERLREMGAQEGDTVRVDDVEFAFSDEG